MASALADWRASRSGSVFRPRSASQASNGPGMPPPLDRQALTSASSPASRLTTAPRITSECPEIALVSEYSEAVAPASSGRWSRPVATVLSTIMGAPARAARAPRRLRSATRSSGFVGVSAHSTEGAAVSSRSTAARSRRSTGTGRVLCGRNRSASTRPP